MTYRDSGQSFGVFLGSLVNLICIIVGSVGELYLGLRI